MEPPANSSYVARNEDDLPRSAWGAGLASQRPSVGQSLGINVPLLYAEEDEDGEEAMNFRDDDRKANDVPARLVSLIRAVRGERRDDPDAEGPAARPARLQDSSTASAMGTPVYWRAGPHLDHRTSARTIKREAAGARQVEGAGVEAGASSSQVLWR